MKWIGQHIWDFISRFRSDVYLEDLADPGSDTDKFLVVDTNNKVGYRTGAEVLSDIGASSESTDLEFNGSTANGILTYGGAAQIDVESQLTYDNTANSQILYDTHPSGSFNSYLLDIDVTADWATGSNHGYGFSQLFDKNANTASGSTNLYTGFKSEIHDTSSDNDGDTILTGLFQDIDFSNNSGDGVLTIKGIEQTLNYGDYQYGIHTTIADGSDSADKTFGIWQKITDGGIDLKFVSSADEDDSFTIATGANGATVIDTNDDSGSNLANISFTPAGKLIINPTSTITEFGDGTNTAQVIRRMAQASSGTGGSITLMAGEANGDNQGGGDLKLYSGKSTGSGVFGDVEFYAGATGASAGVANSHSLVSKLGGNAATSTDQYWYEKAGASSADYFKLSVAEHGVTTLSTTDGSTNHSADLTFTVDGKTTFTCADEPGGGTVFHLDANADTDNIVDIDAGVLDIDVDSAATLNAATSWTVTSPETTFESSTSHKPVVEIKNTNTDVHDPHLKFNNTKGGSTNGADGDAVGTIEFWGVDGSQNAQQYGEINTRVDVAAHGEESGAMYLKVANHDGGVLNGITLTGGSVDDEIDVSIGAGAASLTTIAGTLTMGSTAFVNNSGVIQVATQGTIDHDSLANFVANEHIDWTGDVSASSVIHTNNITDLHGAGVDGTENALLTDDGDGTVTSEPNLYFYTHPSFSFMSQLYIGSSDGGDSEIIKVTHDNGAGGDLVIKAGGVDSGGSNTDLDGGDLKFYTGIPTGTGDFGNFQFYAGDTQTSSGTANHPNSKIAQLESNGAISTDFTLYEKAGTTNDDYFKIACKEHGATTLSTLDDAAHAANLTLAPDGDIFLDNDGIGLTKITSDGVEIENSSTSGAPALLIDNDDADQTALKIEAANTSATIVDVDASQLSTGFGVRIQDDSYERSTGHVAISVTDTHTATIDRGGNGLLKVDYNRPSGSSVASAQSVSAIGAEIRMDDNATNNLGNTSITGLDVHCDFANTGAGINTATGIVTRVGGGDVNQDIKMINDADDSEYVTIRTGAGGVCNITTASDDATGHITLSADGNITLTSGTDHHNYTSIKRRKMTVTSSSSHNDHDGDVVYFGAADGSVSQGDICYLGKDGSNNATWFRAQANAESTSTSLLAICLGTDPATDGMLLRVCLL